MQQELEKQPKGYLNVIMGHLAMDTFWEQALHQNSILIFNLALQGLQRVAVINVPYQIHHLEYNGENGEHGDSAGDSGAKDKAAVEAASDVTTEKKT